MKEQGVGESVLRAGKYTTGAAEEKARREEEARERTRGRRRIGVTVTGLKT